MREPFRSFTSGVIPLPAENIDTDQIIPARYLKTTDKSGLGEALFRDWRYEEDGTPKPGFVLNRPEMEGRQILLAGDNFGCGSSREHAPWALTAWGIRAVISSSCADIFRNNALKNGLVPITVDPSTHARLFDMLAADPDIELTVDGIRSPYHARTATPGEKAELWPAVVGAYPGYAGYQRRTVRDIPVVICEPR